MYRHWLYLPGLALVLARTALGQQLPAHIRVVNDDAPAGGDGRSWFTAYRDLQVALSQAAGSSGQITELWVAGGTYHPIEPGGPCTTPFVVSGIALYGGFAGTETQLSQRDSAANPTILEGSRQGSNSSWSCGPLVRLQGGPSTVLDGFVLRGAPYLSDVGGLQSFGAPALHLSGSPNLRNCHILSHTFYTALRLESAAPVHIADCYLEGRSAYTGTGIAATGDIRMTNCRIWALSHVGAYGLDAASLELNGCSLGAYGDVASAIRVQSITARDSIITATGGWGASGLAVGNAELLRCDIRADVVQGDGASSFDFLTASQCRIDAKLVIGQSATVIGSTIRGYINASWGAASSAISGSSSSNATFRCSTILGGGRAAAVACPNSNWSFENCVAWGVSPPGPAITMPSGLPMAASYSCIQGWTLAMGGTANFSSDPVLDGRGRPGAGSSVIDAGNTAALPPGLTRDLGGGCRVVDGDANGSRLLDSGAYEYSPCAANCDCSTVSPILNIADLTCFLERYAAGDAWANCDDNWNGWASPLFSVADFTCFLERFAAGCP
jgi:hypothetical protein